MYPSISDAKLTMGQLLARLRHVYRASNKALYSALQTSSATYLKIERGERELSFLMALRVCQFYKLDLHEFISMLSDEELGRQDYSVIRVQQQRERKKVEAAKAKVIDIKTDEIIPEVRL
jgi:transcriptional regulator with XRE-family HTH domain